MISRNKLFNHFLKQNFVKNQNINTKCSKFTRHILIPPAKLCSQHQISTQTLKVKVKQNVEPVNKFTNRSHTCGQLTINNVDENVHICGWLEFERMGKFFILRDSYGSTQCIINEQTELSKQIQALPYESVISVTGTVIPRPKDQYNPKMITGEIEVQVQSVEILNLAKSQLPFSIRNFSVAKESLQMKYRYLALRFPELQRNLRIRSWITMRMREFLVNESGFVDVTTPTLFRKTPGGAQEFVVPTKQLGKFYSLVQSPQQFKQLLMVGGIDRYFQFAQCYRDEGSRSDRQPEFTQLDIEMSFVDQKGLINLVEKIICNSWPEFLEKLQLPFPCLTYEEAMEKYGSDCPDLRIPGRIFNLSDALKSDDNSFDKSVNVYATVFNEKQQFFTKSAKEKLINLSKMLLYKARLVQLKVSDSDLSELSKIFSESTRKNIVEHLNLKKGDILFLTYGSRSDARQLLGKIRERFVEILESKGEVIRSSGYKFTWITDFPLFSFNDDTQQMETSHHPFTAPHPEDIQYLTIDPLKVRGLQYDLVMNGSEIGGGSIRIHKEKLQDQIFKLLGINSTTMYYLMDALDSGAPPHGGFALGFDRYVSLICEASSIRDVIAFPKSMEGRDLMSDAPTFISTEDKKLYNIEVTNQSLTKQENL